MHASRTNTEMHGCTTRDSCVEKKRPIRGIMFLNGVSCFLPGYPDTPRDFWKGSYHFSPYPNPWTLTLKDARMRTLWEGVPLPVGGPPDRNFDCHANWPSSVCCCCQPPANGDASIAHFSILDICSLDVYALIYVCLLDTNLSTVLTLLESRKINLSLATWVHFQYPPSPVADWSNDPQWLS